MGKGDARRHPSLGPGVRYEARDALPATLAFSQGLQHVALQVSIVVLVAVIVFRAGGAEELPFVGRVRLRGIRRPSWTRSKRSPR